MPYPDDFKGTNMDDNDWAYDYEVPNEFTIAVGKEILAGYSREEAFKRVKERMGFVPETKSNT